MTPRRILFAVALHWEQSIAEVQQWPWTLFCGAYADMIDGKRRETLRDRRLKRKQREERALEQGHAEGRRMLDGDGF